MMKNKKLFYGILTIAVLAIAGIGLLVLNRLSTTPTPAPTSTQEVTITTDKTEYRQGEIVEIIVRNGFIKPIWYMEEGCPSCCGLYKWENNKWEVLGSIRSCTMYTWPYTPRVDKLEPQEEIKIKWNTGMPFKKEEFIESGVYKFSFYYGLTKDSYTNTKKTIYSNEFTIK